MNPQDIFCIAIIWAIFVSSLCFFIRGASDRRHADWKRAAGIDIKLPATPEVSA